MTREQEREQARSREQAHGRCLNYALGYLDALAGNAATDDAREAARQAGNAIREMLIVVPPRWRPNEGANKEGAC